MVPTLLDTGKQQQHDYLYWEFHEQDGKQAVRRGPWKGVRLNTRVNPDASIELYNLENDLEEEQNVADQHPQIVQEMVEIMERSHVPSETFQLFN